MYGAIDELRSLRLAIPQWSSASLFAEFSMGKE